MVLLGSDGKVIHVNAAATGLLARTGDLFILGGQLIARNNRAASELAKTIDVAAGHGCCSQPVVVVEREQGGRPLAVLAIGPPSNGGVMLGRVAAMLFIVDPDATPTSNLQVMARMYGLTAAEQRIVGGLVDGLTLERMAESFAVTLHTLAKTGAHRQADLVRLFMSAPNAYSACDANGKAAKP